MISTVIDDTAIYQVDAIAFARYLHYLDTLAICNDY